MAANDIYRSVTDRIVAELRTGVAPWVQPWSATPGNNKPHNAATGRPYSGVNVILLWIAMAERGWHLPRYLTFRQAKAIGGTVRGGERGTGICFFKPAEAAGDDDDDDSKNYPVLKSFTVFNVAQCDGLPECMMTPDIPKPRHQQVELIEEFIACTGAVITYDAVECPSYFFGLDAIRMLPRDRFNSDDHFQANQT